MKNKKYYLVILWFSVWLLVLISGCSKLGLDDNESKITPTPTLMVLLTEVANGYPAVYDESCLIATYVPVTTDKPQGNLMAWKPGSQPVLAYVGPQNKNWSWYVGDLDIVDPINQKTLYTSQNLKVYGDLTWSPDGASMAVVNLMSIPQDAYTVTVLQPDTNQSWDLFPAQSGITDANAIKKGIEGWEDDQTLVVSAACGLDCSLSYRFNEDGSYKQELDKKRQVEDHNLEITYPEPQYNTDIFPKMNQPHFSPDEKWVTYLDDDDMIWILSVEGKKQYQLGWLGGEIREAKWSPDSSLVAYRMDNRINVYKAACK